MFMDDCAFADEESVSPMESIGERSGYRRKVKLANKARASTRWIRAKAVRVRRKAGKYVVDIKT
jgi:hypothetical protein